jgi:hypothetical protein
MNKTYLLIILLILFLLIGCSTLSQKNSSSEKGARRADIYMLPSCDHHLTMIFNENTQNLIFRDDIFINMKDIKGKKTGAFALDKHIFVEALEINGRSTALDEVWYYMPKNFGSSVRPFRLTQVKRDCKLYEFSYNADSIKTDSIAVTIRYTINPQTDFDFCTIKPGFFKLNGDYIWFPNSLADSVDVNVEIITPASYIVKMGNQLLPFVKNSNYIKTYQAVISDNFAPVIITGEKRR